MKHFTHSEEVPWECHCTKPGYDWYTIVRGRVEIDVNGVRLNPPIGHDEIAEEAVQLNYSVSTEGKEKGNALCKSCDRYRHRIIPNPYRRI